MPYCVQTSLPGSFSAQKRTPSAWAAALTYLFAFWVPVLVVDCFFIWSWLVLFAPCIFSWWVRQAIRAEAATEMGSFEYLVKRLVPAWDGVRFTGFWPAVHHGACLVAAAVLAGGIRGEGPDGRLVDFYYAHLYRYAEGLLGLLDYHLYFQWEVYALAGALQGVVFAVFSLTPLCRDPWRNRVWPKTPEQAPSFPGL